MHYIITNLPSWPGSRWRGRSRSGGSRRGGRRWRRWSGHWEGSGGSVLVCRDSWPPLNRWGDCKSRVWVLFIFSDFGRHTFIKYKFIYIYYIDI